MRTRPFRVSLQLLILGSAGLFWVAAWGGEPVPVQPGFAERAAVPGIDNFARIHEGLFRGAQPDAEGLRWLKRQGVKTVINLRAGYDEQESVEALGMRAVKIEMRAGIFGSTPPTAAQVREFFRIVTDPANQPVFFHCKKGQDRAGTMAALYRLEYDGWENSRAIDEMQDFGFNDYFRDLMHHVENYRPGGR